MKTLQLPLNVAGVLFFYAASFAQNLPFSASGFSEIGRSPEINVRDLGMTGGTVYNQDNSSEFNDGGIRVSLESPFTFTTVGESLVYSYSYTKIRTMGLNRSNSIRSGFDFLSANIHFHIGLGSEKPDVRAWFNNTGNEFQSGTVLGEPELKALDNTNLRFGDGNTLNIEMELTLTGITDLTLYDYNLRATISSPDGASYTLERSVSSLKSNIVIGLYHLSNDAFIEKNGVEWTVANAQLRKQPKVARIPEASSAGAASFLAVLAWRMRK